MKNLKIRVRIVAPVIIALILCAAAILIVVGIKFESYVSADMTETLVVNMRVLERDLLERETNAKAAALLASEDPEIAGVLVKGDHDAAVAIAQKVMSEVGVDFITIMLPNADILARGHNAEKFGDNLGDLPSVVAARNGNVTAGIETGNTMPLTVRGGAPVYGKNGVLVGLINAGYDLSKTDFIDSEKALLDSEVTIFAGDTRIATTVIGADGQRAVGTQAAEHVSKQVLGGVPYIGKAVVSGQDSFVNYSPLVATNGQVIGMLFVGEYSQDASDTVFQFILLGVCVALVLSVIVTVFVLWSSKSITDPIAMMMSYLRQISSTGSLEFTQAEWAATRSEAVYKDEISQSLKAFVDMLEHFIYYGDYLKKAATLDFSEEIKELSVRDTFGHGISEVVHGISSALNDVRSATNQMQQCVTELAGASGNLANDAQCQAQSIDGLNESVNDIRALAEENSELAAKALHEVVQTG